MSARDEALDAEQVAVREQGALRSGWRASIAGARKATALVGGDARRDRFRDDTLLAGV